MSMLGSGLMKPHVITSPGQPLHLGKELSPIGGNFICTLSSIRHAYLGIKALFLSRGSPDVQLGDDTVVSQSAQFFGRESILRRR
jgi:hypothetical protein